MSQTVKILWAVDAFAENPQTQLAVLKALEPIAAARQARIEPVCVLSPEDLRVSKDAFDGVSRDYRLDAEKHLAEWIAKANCSRLDPPKLLLQPRLSLSSTVDTLLGYARENRVELIGLARSTRRGVDRFLLGSFVETATLRSEVPLLVVGVGAPVDGPRRVLFATDLSDSSRTAFNAFLPTAKALGAEVLLYTRGEYVLPAESAPVTGFSLNFLSHLKLDVVERRRAAERWVAEAAGIVPVRLVVDHPLASTSDAIVSAAKREGADLIALASRSGPVVSAVLGGIARHVIRCSPVPVWVLHPPSRG